MAALNQMFIVDETGRIWTRFGSTIELYTAICVWDNMMVLGGGTAARPNLVFANYNAVTEMGDDVNDDFDAHTITSTWRSPNFAIGSFDSPQQVRMFDVLYKDQTAWSSAGNYTFSVAYRLDGAEISGVPAFANYISFTLDNSTTAYTSVPVFGADNKTHVAHGRLLTLPCNFIQFQFSWTGAIEILGYKFNTQILPKK